MYDAVYQIGESEGKRTWGCVRAPIFTSRMVVLDGVVSYPDNWRKPSTDFNSAGYLTPWTGLIKATPFAEYYNGYSGGQTDYTNIGVFAVENYDEHVGYLYLNIGTAYFFTEPESGLYSEYAYGVQPYQFGYSPTPIGGFDFHTTRQIFNGYIVNITINLPAPYGPGGGGVNEIYDVEITDASGLTLFATFDWPGGAGSPPGGWWTINSVTPPTP